MNATVTASQVLDYFPFGKTLRAYHGAEKEKYQFNGKERDGETEWDYFGARYYDGDVGRFMAVDPLATKFNHSTPYNFAANNPILYVDVNGMAADKPINSVQLSSKIDDGKETKSYSVTFFVD
jgi:RHS repeat-associated protein